MQIRKYDGGYALIVETHAMWRHSVCDYAVSRLFGSLYAHADQQFHIPPGSAG
jgi:hypothetical protein